jgi:rhodanese-related sulfurtransferase
MPEPADDARPWLRESYVEFDEFRRIRPVAAGVITTPTTLLVDENGIVERIWKGKLAPREQASLLAVLSERTNPFASASGPVTDTLPAEIGPASLRELRKQGSLQLLDVRGRSHFFQGHTPGATNLSLDELEIRGPIELDPGELTVVDCTRVPKPIRDMAARLLFSIGFARVAALREPSETPPTNLPCPTCPQPKLPSGQ